MCDTAHHESLAPHSDHAHGVLPDQCVMPPIIRVWLLTQIVLMLCCLIQVCDTAYHQSLVSNSRQAHLVLACRPAIAHAAAT